MTAFTAAGTTRTTRSKVLITVEGAPGLSRRGRGAAPVSRLWAGRRTLRVAGTAVLACAAGRAPAAARAGVAGRRVPGRLPRARARCPFDARDRERPAAAL